MCNVDSAQRTLLANAHVQSVLCVILYRSENHVQWHWYIEVECIIVQYAGHKKHCHQNDVAAVADSQRFTSKFGRENEALKCNE